MDEIYFEKCQNLCYSITKDTNKFPTINILQEIFTTSICHSESFGRIPLIINHMKFVEYLGSQAFSKEKFLSSLTNFCKLLIWKNKDIFLNPSFKSEFPNDCDLVIGDTLFDIKCCKVRNEIYNILQLLAYCSLHRFDPNFTTKINNLSIIDLYFGKVITYSVSKLTDTNYKNFIELLNNK